MTLPTTLAGWLSHLESLHLSSIDLGLERVRQVVDAMPLRPGFPVITVGGTNGKGSVCAMLTRILASAGYRVGTYTSPHLMVYNERIAIDAESLSDEAIVRGLAAVEAGRGDVPLTYFEFGTLAAMWNFVDAKVDVAILEVGLGGRLDAVNVFEPDCAAVVSVDLDHQDWLGDNREDIGFEKAGIFRAGKPALCADPQPPARLVGHAAAIGAPLWLAGRDFGFTRTDRCSGSSGAASPGVMRCRLRPCVAITRWAMQHWCWQSLRPCVTACRSVPAPCAADCWRSNGRPASRSCPAGR